MKDSLPRRHFLKTGLRTLAFGGLAGLGIFLGLRPPPEKDQAACPDTLVCSGCSALAGCRLPKAQPFRKGDSRRTGREGPSLPSASGETRG